MRRGFKTKAERLSLRLRRDLEIRPYGALPAELLAQKLQIEVIGPKDIPGLDGFHIHHLLNRDASGWSAFTVEVESRVFVVHNSSHASTRQESNIMHELAHILCKHPAGRVVQIGSLHLRHYNPEHEEEAVWLGACLQIPREALLWTIRRGMENSEIALHFGASEDLVRFRRNCTGVDKQLARASAFRR